VLPFLDRAESRSTSDFTADYLVIGSGIAGLWFSYRASRYGSVIIVTKKEDTESNTNYAQGGIAAAVDDDDTARLHCEDTLRAGAGIAHEDVAQIVTQSGPALVRELAGLGVGFTTYHDAMGRLHFDLGQEGGHRRRRIVHARDFTGLEVERGLLAAVRAHPRVRVIEQHLAVDLVLDQVGHCQGATVLDCERQTPAVIRARVTMLATGGIGQAYRYTTNPTIATGDGIAMGFRAGARVANMEFIQFHPTALFGAKPGDRAFLISEAVRGEGAVLRTRDGRAFMPDYHPDAELAPRDVVARAIAREMHRRGDEYVLLDATHLDPDRIRGRFPNIYRTCRELGIDMTREPLPVVPAAHYVCGGLQTNIWAETSIPGLFAAGECACSGLHGANRLASNSLLEALVMADRAAVRCQELESGGAAAEDWSHAARSDLLAEGMSAGGGDRTAVADWLREVQELMWQYAGIVRTDSGLARARAELADLEKRARTVLARLSAPAVEFRNLLLVARLVVECCCRRKESRGLHYNEDHPDTDPVQARDTTIERAQFNA
jgi:L-aspartate oxidase